MAAVLYNLLFNFPAGNSPSLSLSHHLVGRLQICKYSTQDFVDWTYPPHLLIPTLLWCSEAFIYSKTRHLRSLFWTASFLLSHLMKSVFNVIFLKFRLLYPSFVRTLVFCGHYLLKQLVALQNSFTVKIYCLMSLPFHGPSPGRVLRKWRLRFDFGSIGQTFVFFRNRLTN